MTRQPAEASDYIVFLLLLCLIVSCAFFVVYNAFKNRQLYISLNKSMQQYASLEIEYGRLLLEESAWSSPAQIEQAANKQLGMHAPSVEQIVVVPFSTALKAK